MSICISGLKDKPNLSPVSITVSEKHPLIRLLQIISWAALLELVLPDLQTSTAKGLFERGRKLKVRIHLAVYLLQKIYDMTDREAEWTVKGNAAFQIFCGKGIVENWHAPDHTKIEEFRSRLKPETQRALNNYILTLSRDLGFADPSKMDIDSTIQEPNMAFPSDATMLVKISQIAEKVYNYIDQKLTVGANKVVMKTREIKGKAKEYFFSKQKDIESKKAVLVQLNALAVEQVTKVTQIFLTPVFVEKMPWNIRRAWNQLKTHAGNFLSGVEHFIETNKRDPNKPISFHLNQVGFFNKNKANKKTQFGRAYQLGRIGGNFLMVGESTSVRMEDKQSVIPMIEEHQKIFGEEILQSFGTDKGYYKTENLRFLDQHKSITDFALQKPGFNPACLTKEDQTILQSLSNRRAGIEPLIGHAKQGGQLNKSRMKSDQTILAAGYGAITGFNCRQLMRHLSGVEIKAM